MRTVCRFASSHNQDYTEMTSAAQGEIQRRQRDIFCVELDVKLQLSLSINRSINAEMTVRRAAQIECGESSSIENAVNYRSTKASGAVGARPYRYRNRPGDSADHGDPTLIGNRPLSASSVRPSVHPFVRASPPIVPCLSPLRAACRYHRKCGLGLFTPL